MAPASRAGRLGALRFNPVHCVQKCPDDPSLTSCSMKLNRHPELPSTLTQRTPSELNRVVGFICLLIGVGFAALSIFFGWGQFFSGKPPSAGGFTAVAMIFGIACFLFVAGSRLVYADRHGRTLFGAPVWYAIAAIFGLLCLFAIYVAYIKGFDARVGQLLALVALFVLFAYGAGSYSSRSRRKRG